MESFGEQMRIPNAGCDVAGFVRWLLGQGRLNHDLSLVFLHPSLTLDLSLFRFHPSAHLGLSILPSFALPWSSPIHLLQPPSSAGNSLSSQVSSSCEVRAQFRFV